MYRLLALIVTALALALTATPTYAESASWQADPPKNATDPVIWCVASATAGSDSYTMRNYASLDDGTYDAQAYAKRVFSEDVVRAMLFRFPGRPHTITAADVVVSCGK